MSSEALHLPLKGKTAIVTGGSRGIGAEIVYELAKRGAEVTFTNVSNSTKANEVQRRVQSLPNAPKCQVVRANLREPKDIDAIITSALSTQTSKPEAERRIDILVNNAGCELVKSLANITLEDYSYVYDLNVRGAILMTQAVLPHLPAGGRIINISSVGARCGFRELSLYCSSKAALEGLTRCWAAELGGNGTTVNAVNPGPVQSEMLDNIPKEIVDAQKKATPVEQRVGTVEEIAAIVAFLAGGDSKWITGQCLSASGGWTMY